ncbi:MAG TPA: ATP-dependent DNA helicase [Nocardioidaceae bacterium]|nr:ATP-dependent DNA helicase [Nocardioidaceae bacterium]
MTKYHLAYPTPGKAAPPALDGFQKAVVEHEGGPLLVLAGPGTGKTTTLVEAIVDRIENRGVAPESVLALTFSRKAAEHLRDRVTARLGATMSTTLSSTFHSFAYGLLRAHAPTELYAAPLRLLSAPEQDVILRDLLREHYERVHWPEGLVQALDTRGFAREVHAVLGRAREKGLDPEDLILIGEQDGRPEWVAAGHFMEEYLNNLDFQSAVDYPNLTYRAVLMAETPQMTALLRGRYSHVFVDEYQDTDPSQVRLLRAVAGDGRNLMVVGDPDQSIYAFRGAEVRGILDFPDEFRRSDGARAPVAALGTTRRFGSRLLTASRRVAGLIPTKGAIGREIFERFRDPMPGVNEFGPGEVEVRLFDTARAETEHLADILRRAHLEDNIAWSEMAVLVRSGRATIPALRRSLMAAGVEVEVAGDELPLVREPAVLPLLRALEAVVHLRIDDDAAIALLMSPLGGLDAAEVRRLARDLRAAEKVDALAEDRPPHTSHELLGDAVLTPGVDLVHPGRPATKAARLARLLARAHAQLAGGATAEEVLWTLWEGTTWPRYLRAVVERGGPAARLAHRDLDSLCALFDTAARAEQQRGHTSVASFLEELNAQQIPADTLAERGVRGESVRLLTAHRSKGLEWRLVVVAGVQEGSWPDLRRRTTLLQADRLGSAGLLPPVTTRTLVADERRLFYVACTRARQRLVVTAVKSPEEDGEQPSRFLDDLDVRPSMWQGRPHRPLSLAGLVAELRRTVSDPATPEGLKRAAATRLAALASTQWRGERLAPEADPANWWGTRARSMSERPIRAADRPLTLSASALEGLLTCPVRWFLEREAGGASVSTASQGFGLVVHALADRVAKGEVTDVEELLGHVDKIWNQMVFDTPWAATKQRVEVEKVIRRFVDWHNRPGARTVIATERQMTATVTLPDGQLVTLNGWADRLELDEQGLVVVVDFKTGKNKPADTELPQNPQLGLYQLAVDSGAVDDLVASGAGSGGAELVQLRHDAKGLPKVQRQEPQQPDAEGRTPVQIQLMSATGLVRSEQLVARENLYCDRCSFQAICPVKGSGTVLS